MSISAQQNKKDNPLLRVPLAHRQDWRAFMGNQMKLPEGDTRWQGMCESLQRQGHGFPATFASAYAHLVATPQGERLDPREAPIGGFIFVDDPHDSNAYGHIVGKWSRDGDHSLETIPVATNDVGDSESGYDPGNVTVCPLGWFPKNWGDSVQFATLWFGGTDIPTVDPQTGEEDTEVWVRKAIDRAHGVIEMMRKALKDNDGTTHPRHEAALKREIADQREFIASLHGLLP
jgi:hypothetical protein